MSKDERERIRQFYDDPTDDSAWRIAMMTGMEELGRLITCGSAMVGVVAVLLGYLIYIVR